VAANYGKDITKIRLSDETYQYAAPGVRLNKPLSDAESVAQVMQNDASECQSLLTTILPSLGPRKHMHRRL
jgi:hypothetical protein